MSLTGKQEDDWTFRIVDNLAQTLKVGEEQMSTLVSGKAAAEADDQSVGIEALKKLDHSLRVTLVLQPSLLILLADVLKEFLLQSLASCPYFLIGTVVDAVPDFFVRLVAEMFCVEVLGINLSPFRSTPSGEMNAVGDVADMALFGIIAVPDAVEHLLADLAMQPAHAINLLTSVAGECAHAELLTVVVGIRAAHSDEFIPTDTQHLRIAAHVLAEEFLVEVVVTGRHGSVYGIERRGTNDFECLVECQAITDVVAQALQVAECGMSLVAMVNVLLDAELLEQKHTANAEKNLLLQAVLPIATIEGMGDGLVELRVHLVVGVEQIQFHATHIHSPNQSMHMIVHIRNVDNHRCTVLVELLLDRQ